MKSYFRKYGVSVIIISLMISFPWKLGKINSQPHVQGIYDLPQIREKGKMVVVTDFNSFNYFIYHGKPMGFQYELLQELADYTGLELEVKVSNDLEANYESLVQGEVDLIASNLTITKSRREQVAFTIPHSMTSQVLIQKIPEGAKTVSGVNSGLIRNPIELAGKTIHVPKGSAYEGRLINLEEEIGEEINIVEANEESEQLIKMVASGEISFTVADENIARVNKRSHPEIDIETSISFPQNVAWAVRKDAVLLRKEIDMWLESFKKTQTFANIYNKYFKNPVTAFIVKSDYYYPATGRISRYDQILKRECEKIGWDWRLLSSLIYQESRFNDSVVSLKGAFGLMQLMPATAKNFGVDEQSSPEEHIMAGIAFIRVLDERFMSIITDKEERTRFVLASYNVGFGHVKDAMKLAEKNGKDPLKWIDNVEIYLLKKSEPEFYNDPDVSYGYCNGSETYAFVRQIMYRYDHYLTVGALIQ